MTKTCTKCNNSKNIKEFGTNKKSHDGLYYWCKACKRVYDKAYKIKNRDKILVKKREDAKKYRLKHKDKIRSYIKFKLETDTNYKLSKNLRIRLSKSIRYSWKSGSSVKDLGCSISELKSHLESQFRDGMSWQNWGRDGWHIDHKIPLVKFDLTDRTQFLKAVHYTNMQPLWAFENLSKGATT